MMKYLFINSVYGVRSTGKLVREQCHKLLDEGHQCVAAYGREAEADPDVRLLPIGTSFSHGMHAIASRAVDLHGQCSDRSTKKFLKTLEGYSPDVIWMHNLHGYYINFHLLFSWLKRHPEIKKYWTLHDCWAFTGHCAYFTIAGCERWKEGCGHCPQLRTYPTSYGPDFSARNWRKKRLAFTGVQNLTLVTPPKWLADLTRESFLAEYPVKVIHNTIDQKIFRPVSGNFRKRYGLEGCYMILGVAVGMDETKGFSDMIKLRSLLSERYTIVLVGVTGRQIRSLPRGMIGIKRTANQQELAEMYTAADVFVNPTHQDNYPTVNLEAASCGTPVLTYDVGGSPESVPEENVVAEGNISALAARIIQICEEQRGTKEPNE